MKVRWRIVGLAFLIVLAIAGFNSARWLVVNDPAKSDVIVVLAGETDLRPKLGLRLLQEGYAPVMVIDVPAEQRVYEWTYADLAQRWASQMPEAGKIRICPIKGLSTKAEAHDAAECLGTLQPRSVLLVTSDYHSRRALSTFRHELPQIRFSMAAAFDTQEFGFHWWTHREWAKTTLYENMRLAWWELVDRWH